MMTPDFFPDDLYFCLLDAQPDYLTPPRLMTQRDGAGPLMINPACVFAWRGPPSADVAARIGRPDGLFVMPWMVWIDDSATGMVTPFWLGPELAHLLEPYSPGDGLAERPRDDLLALLWSAEIVVTPDHAVRRRAAWTARAAAARAFAPRGWVAVESLLHPFHIGALRRHYRRQARLGKLALGDGQTDRRFFAHNEPVARFFHRQLTLALSDIAGAPLKPSYTYTALYQGGADLEPHTDREQCEYTFSLCFDATPEPAAQVPWPLEVQTHEGPVQVWQFLGDGLLFRGRYLPHGRGPLAGDQTVSNILFHYVDVAFDGPLD